STASSPPRIIATVASAAAAAASSASRLRRNAGPVPAAITTSAPSAPAAAAVTDVIWKACAFSNSLVEYRPLGRTARGVDEPPCGEDTRGTTPYPLPMASAPSIGTQLVMRLETPNTPGSFGVLASAIGDAGGMVGAVDTRTVGKTTITRDVTVNVPSELVGEQVRAAIEK